MKLSQSLRSQASHHSKHDPLSDDHVLEDQFNIIMLPHGVKNGDECWVSRRQYSRKLNGYY